MLRLNRVDNDGIFGEATDTIEKILAKSGLFLGPTPGIAKWL